MLKPAIPAPMMHTFVRISSVRGAKCGVAVVHLPSGRLAALLEFKSGVDEVFDVQVMPGIRHPILSGPFAGQDNGEMIWRVPPPGSL